MSHMNKRPDKAIHLRHGGILDYCPACPELNDSAFKHRQFNVHGSHFGKHATPVWHS